MRFHLLDGTTKQYEEVIQAAHEAGINVGIELPCEPDKESSLFALLEQLDELPIQFLNLNELEITTGNQENMDVRGFNLSNGLSAAAEGSFELGVRLKKAAKGKSYHLKFCTASYKDAGQLRARFRRRAEATLRPYEVLSEDDTILFGAIPTEPEDARDDMLELQDVLTITPSWLRYDAIAKRIEMPLSVAEELAEILAVPVQMIEVHPTHERLEVSTVHLNN